MQLIFYSTSLFNLNELLFRLIMFIIVDINNNLFNLNSKVGINGLEVLLFIRLLGIDTVSNRIQIRIVVDPVNLDMV
jgi:hypothetical protein